MDTKPIKLSAAMKNVIDKLRDGYYLKFQETNGKVFLDKGMDVIPVHYNTLYFMRRKNLVDFHIYEQAPTGRKQLFSLTDLGKTIAI